MLKKWSKEKKDLLVRSVEHQQPRMHFKLNKWGVNPLYSAETVKYCGHENVEHMRKTVRLQTHPTCVLLRVGVEINLYSAESKEGEQPEFCQEKGEGGVENLNSAEGRVNGGFVPTCILLKTRGE